MSNRMNAQANAIVQQALDRAAAAICHSKPFDPACEADNPRGPVTDAVRAAVRV